MFFYGKGSPIGKRIDYDEVVWLDRKQSTGINHHLLPFQVLQHQPIITQQSQSHPMANSESSWPDDDLPIRPSLTSSIQLRPRAFARTSLNTIYRHPKTHEFMARAPREDKYRDYIEMEISRMAKSRPYVPDLDDTEGDGQPYNESIDNHFAASSFESFQGAAAVSYPSFGISSPPQHPQGCRRSSISGPGGNQPMSATQHQSLNTQRQQNFTPSSHGNIISSDLSAFARRQADVERYETGEGHMQSEAEDTLRRNVKNSGNTPNMERGPNERYPYQARLNGKNAFESFGKSGFLSSYREMNLDRYGAIQYDDYTFSGQSHAHDGHQGYGKSPRTPLGQRDRSPASLQSLDEHVRGYLTPAPARRVAPQTPSIGANRLQKFRGNIGMGSNISEIDVGSIDPHTAASRGSHTSGSRSNPFCQSTLKCPSRVPLEDSSTPLEQSVRRGGAYEITAANQQTNEFDPNDVLPRFSLGIRDDRHHVNSTHKPYPLYDRAKSLQTVENSAFGGRGASISLITPEQVPRTSTTAQYIPMKDRITPPILQNPVLRKSESSKQTRKDPIMPKQRESIIATEEIRQKFIANQIVHRETDFEGDELQKTLFGELITENLDDLEIKAAEARAHADHRRQEKERLEKEARELAEKKQADAEAEKIRNLQIKERDEEEKKTRRETERPKQQELEKQLTEQRRQVAAERIKAAREKVQADITAKILEKSKDSQIDTLLKENFKLKQEIGKLRAASLNNSSLTPLGSRKRKRPIPENTGESLFVNKE